MTAAWRGRVGSKDLYAAVVADWDLAPVFQSAEHDLDPIWATVTSFFLADCIACRATVVCVIGGEQEINTGEAGIAEWLKALQTRFPHWDVHAYALLDDPHYTVDQDAKRRLQSPSVHKHSDLHLSVSMRSFRAEILSSFVGAVLAGDAASA